MSFLKKLFGRKTPPPATTTATATATVTPTDSAGVTMQATPAHAVDPANDPNMIRVYDAYGRELFISKAEWRKNILPGKIQSSWNNADDLYNVILNSLDDGFRSEVINATQQLYQIDHNKLRAACIWGIVLTQENRLDEAEKVFRDFLATQGEEGVILTNLAKVYAARDNHAEAERLLWHALELDANQDNGMGWYWIMHKERGGEAAGEEALRRVAAIPGSWRAQVWMARAALEQRNVDAALDLYQQVLARVEKPAPADLLMMMSGDLGNFGHLPEILQLVEPLFVVETHGIQVGNNLIKAHLDLGQFDASRRILDRLFAMNRMDWKPNLSFWETEIAKARVAMAAPVDPNASLKIQLLGFEGPIWLKPTSPAAELFPAKPKESITIFFIGCSVELISNSKRSEHQLADARGRLSRSVPLYLAEQVEFGTTAQVGTLTPWVARETGGFILCGDRLKDEDAVNYSNQGEQKSDYVVITHLRSKGEQWTVGEQWTIAEKWTAELRLVRTIDTRCIAESSVDFKMDTPQEGLLILAQNLIALLAEHTETATLTPPAIYQVPTGVYFGYYLLRLEQLLAVRCAGIDGLQPGFLNGEREIIDGNIQLCVEHPQNICTRILLAQTLLAMHRVRPDVVTEFKQKIERLQKEMPLPEPAHSVVQRLFNDALKT